MSFNFNYEVTVTNVYVFSIIVCIQTLPNRNDIVNEKTNGTLIMQYFKLKCLTTIFQLFSY